MIICAYALAMVGLNSSTRSWEYIVFHKLDV